uniref:Deoxyribonuclease II n=1 Tax=Parascaris univalens TaxID=6257 RepID=A0A915C1B5_PARUN
DKMWASLIQRLLIILNSVWLISASISCRDSTGASVDWFIGYKLPMIEGNRSAISGLSFLYLDGRSTSWSKPEIINSSRSSIALTLAQLYKSIDDPATFYMLYNDEHPEIDKTDSHRGHAKGVAVFNRDSGFWLIHSVPNFPSIRHYAYPPSGYRNGQSFLCITLKSGSLSALATQMLYIQPSIYASQLPTEFASRYPDLQKVVAKKSLTKSATIFHSVVQLESLSGVKFTSFAKHKKFNKDLYSDLVAPQLKTSLLTETWLNGPGDLPSTCSSPYKVNNVLSVRVDGNQFANSKDHSKWAVSADGRDPVLCIGDINRQKSQWGRGGGTVCVRNTPVWSLYKGSITETEPCNGVTNRPNWPTRLWKKMKGVFQDKN